MLMAKGPIAFTIYFRKHGKSCCFFLFHLWWILPYESSCCMVTVLTMSWVKSREWMWYWVFTQPTYTRLGS